MILPCVRQGCIRSPRRFCEVLQDAMARWGHLGLCALILRRSGGGLAWPCVDGGELLQFETVFLRSTVLTQRLDTVGDHNWFDSVARSSGPHVATAVFSFFRTVICSVPCVGLNVGQRVGFMLGQCLRIRGSNVSKMGTSRIGTHGTKSFHYRGITVAAACAGCLFCSWFLARSFTTLGP